MPRRGVKVPKRLWSDGIHYVRVASHKDRHPMRFVVSSLKASASTYTRHAPTKEAAIEIGEAATQRHLKTHPAEIQLIEKHRLGKPTADRDDKATLNTPAGSDGRKTQQEPFSITHFNCIRANPVAQVWQCISNEFERKSGGRRRKDGSPAQARTVEHVMGSSVVLLHKEPVRDERGKVVVYPTWHAAEEAAIDLYDNADEEDRFFWREGDMRVWSTLNVDVIFDPDSNGAAKPFSLYLPEYRRPVYEDRTRPLLQADPVRVDAMINPQTAIDAKEKRKKDRQLNRQPSFEERPLRFRSIYGAIEEAERREKMLKGETAL